MRQYSSSYYREKNRRKTKRKEEKNLEDQEKNVSIKRDNINIEEQFYPMVNMQPIFRSWNYISNKNIGEKGKEEEIILPKDLFFLHPHVCLLLSLSLCFYLLLIAIIFRRYANVNTSILIDVNNILLMIQFNT